MDQIIFKIRRIHQVLDYLFFLQYVLYFKNSKDKNSNSAFLSLFYFYYASDNSPVT